MIDLSNWIAQLPAWLLLLWHGLGKIFQGVLWFLGASEREKISTAVWQNADGTIAKIITTTDTIPAKTVWDFLALVGVPVTLAVLTFVFQARQKEREEKREEAEKTRQDERLREEGNEKALEDYLNQVSTLLIQNNLIQLAQDSPDSPTLETAKGVIRARTLSLLKRLEDDSIRKNTVIGFLLESRILECLQFSLNRANLSKADFSFASLDGFDLSEADLSSANLPSANLSGANLRDAKLNGAVLTKADLSGANLRGTKLNGAVLTNADLSDASLSGADLSGAKLYGTNFSGAEFYIADFSGAKLLDANLSGAKLFGTNFSSAIFQRTIMPDGIVRSGEDAERYIEELMEE